MSVFMLLWILMTHFSVLLHRLHLTHSYVAFNHLRCLPLTHHSSCTSVPFIMPLLSLCRVLLKNTSFTFFTFVRLNLMWKNVNNKTTEFVQNTLKLSHWEHSNIRTSEHQNIRTSEHQNIRTSGHQNIRTLEHQNIRTSEHQNIRTSEHQNIRTSKH